MNIGLIDVDGHNFPNLALMKISAYHKAKGDNVEWCFPPMHYDIVYQSKVFDSTYSPDIDWTPLADQIIKGGTGYGLDNQLPYEIEHMYPDYSLYPELTKDTAYGFLTRGCPRHCHFCIVGDKEGLVSHKVADLSEWWNGQKYIELLDPNTLACKDHLQLLQQLIDSKAYVNFNQGVDCRLLNEENVQLIHQVRKKNIHFAWDYMKYEKQVLRGLDLYKNLNAKKIQHVYATVYVLTNYDTTMEENLYRINEIWARGYYPYIMVYDKPNAPREIKKLQRWCNNRFIFKSCTWEEYKRGQK